MEEKSPQEAPDEKSPHRKRQIGANRHKIVLYVRKRKTAAKRWRRRKFWISKRKVGSWVVIVVITRDYCGDFGGSWGDHSNSMRGPKLKLVYLCCDVFIPIHYCIYPYLIEFLYLTCIPMLLILFHTSSSLYSEVFIPIHCCIYRCLIEYLYLCGVKLQKKEVFIKKGSS